MSNHTKKSSFHNAIVEKVVPALLVAIILGGANLWKDFQVLANEVENQETKLEDHVKEIKPQLKTMSSNTQHNREALIRIESALGTTPISNFNGRLAESVDA